MANIRESWDGVGKRVEVKEGKGGSKDREPGLGSPGRAGLAHPLILQGVGAYGELGRGSGVLGSWGCVDWGGEREYLLSQG